jgi:glycosyltransferase involved in cell wall biosynthesis
MKDTGPFNPPQVARRIVIIGSAHPLRGGLASYNERLAREFVREGDQVTIYNFSLQYPGFLFPGTTQYSSEPAPQGLDIRVKINSVNPFNWISVGNELKRLKPDIIVVKYWMPFMGPCLGTILRLVKKNHYTRVICIVDNIVPHEKRPGDLAFTRYFVKPVDAFITMSEKVWSDLKTFVTDKPSLLVPHPLFDNFGEKISKAAAREKLRIGMEERILLFFGFIRKYKGLDLLLEAMLLLVKQASGGGFIMPTLVIAGEFYEDRKLYDQLLANPLLKPHLVLKTDFIPDSAVRDFLCAADVVVQPYRSATQSGVTPLAYHFEKPMIVTNVGGLPDLVPDGKVGLVAEPTAESIARKIREFYEHGEAFFLPGLLEEKQKYEWRNMTKAIKQLANSAM